ncbi:hypothetical protein C0J52_10659 [Blattella germanica]|nr:hypothetical protein C0J52_10659 [Blattella germanica]
MPDHQRSHQPVLLQKYCCQRRHRPACITVTVLGFVIAAILLAFVAFGQDETPHSSLRLVSIVFRHGDRTPSETYPLDPHRDENVWPEGWGQLTKEGKNEMYELGQFLRSRYDGYLDKIYSSREVLVKSSALDRCLMSAQLALAGLFPPVGHQVWNDKLLWQPIPVYSTPRNLDQLINVKKPCPLYQEELRGAYKSSKIQELNRKNLDLYQYLSRETGQEIRNVTGVELLYNTLEIEEKHGLTLPEWTRSVYPGKMKHLAATSLAILTNTNNMKKLVGGPLVGEITRNMDNKRNGDLKPDTKMFLYAGHDVTLVNIWRTLGFTDLIKPDFGAALIFELHLSKSGVNHEVKMLYRNNTSTRNLIILNIPNCNHPCHLETFLDITESVIPMDWNLECQRTAV